MTKLTLTFTAESGIPERRIDDRYAAFFLASDLTQVEQQALERTSNGCMRITAPCDLPRLQIAEGLDISYESAGTTLPSLTWVGDLTIGCGLIFAPALKAVHSLVVITSGVLDLPSIERVDQITLRSDAVVTMENLLQIDEKITLNGGRLNAPKVNRYARRHMPSKRMQQALLADVADKVIENPKRLDMFAWHSPCGTAHCIAGWGVKLAGGFGASLEGALGTQHAAILLLGLEAAHHFHEGDVAALAWLKTVQESA